MNQRESVSENLDHQIGGGQPRSGVQGFNISEQPRAAPLALAVVQSLEARWAGDLGGLGPSRQARAVGENPTDTTVELRPRERVRGWVDDGGGFRAGRGGALVSNPRRCGA